MAALFTWLCPDCGVRLRTAENWAGRPCPQRNCQSQRLAPVISLQVRRVQIDAATATANSSSMKRAADAIVAGYRLLMVYGHHDFAPRTNFVFVLVPQRGQGVQWRRDVLPALKQFVRGHFNGAVSMRTAVVGINDHTEEAARLLQEQGESPIRQHRIWLLWDRGEFVRVSFGNVARRVE